MKKLRIISLGMLIFAIFLFVGVEKINADDRISSSFPNSITSDYGSLFYTDGIAIYKKSYDTGDGWAKAMCTHFWDSPPTGKCTAKKWNSDATKNKKIAVAMGAMLNKARTISNQDGGLTWTNYFYTEMAMNMFLYNYNGKDSDNNVSRISGFSKVSSNSTYKAIYAAGTTAYDNFGKTSVKFSKPTITVSEDRKTVTVTATLTCYNAAGNETRCSAQVRDTLTIKGTVNGTAYTSSKIGASTYPWNDTEKGYKFTYTKTFDNAFDPGTKVTAELWTKNKVTYVVAQNYNCGSGYQSLTPNSLRNIYEYDETSKSVSTDTGTCSIKIVKTNEDGTKKLKGAKFELYLGSTKEDSGTTNSKGEIVFDGLATGSYSYKEVTAPSGYTLDSTSHTVEITSDSCDVTRTEVNSLATGGLTVYKVDEKNGPVSGAKIKIYTISVNNSEVSGDIPMGEVDDTTDSIDPDNNNYTYEYLHFDANGNYNPNGEYEYFITTDSPKVITGLTVGKTYYIDEEAVPEGSDYAIKVGASSVAMKDAINYDVTLVNNHSKFKISKQDLTSKKEIKGAKLQIFDSRGVERYSWTSTDKPYEIVGLEDGDYTLVETQAPNGYTMAESIKFTIENGQVKNDEDNMIVMYDAFIVEIPDTFSSKNVITMIMGLVLVAFGTGALVYELKKKTA